MEFPLLSKYCEIGFLLSSETVSDIVTVQQVHGNTVVNVADITKTTQADAIISNQNVHIGIKTADCLPILMYDASKQRVAVVHAGWKGLYMGVLQNTLRVLKQSGANPAKLYVAIGPHIEKKCYKVTADRYALFYGISSGHNTNFFLDLAEIALRQLVSSGVLYQHIEISGVCTYCKTRYPSYRRDTFSSNRLISYIGLKTIT